MDPQLQQYCGSCTSKRVYRDASSRPLFAHRFSASNGAIIPPPTGYAPSPLLALFSFFLASSALFSIQETWLLPAYFMRPAAVHPSIQPAGYPSIHPWWIRVSVDGYNLTLHFLRRCQETYSWATFLATRYSRQPPFIPLRWYRTFVCTAAPRCTRELADKKFPPKKM